MLAEHGQKAGADIGKLTFPVALDTQPVHVASFGEALLADQGNIILGLAGDHAGATSGTAVQIDDHPPLVFAL
jgi:hypothetical protein